MLKSYFISKDLDAIASILSSTLGYFVGREDIASIKPFAFQKIHTAGIPSSSTFIQSDSKHIYFGNLQLMSESYVSLSATIDVTPTFDFTVTAEQQNSFIENCFFTSFIGYGSGFASLIFNGFQVRLHKDLKVVSISSADNPLPVQIPSS